MTRKIKIITQAPVTGIEMGKIVNTLSKLAQIQFPDEVTWESGELVKGKHGVGFIFENTEEET